VIVSVKAPVVRFSLPISVTSPVALAFPSEGVRWLELTDAPPATLALAWHPDNRNAAVGALVEMARAVSEAAG
jgi:hypothetical protein